MINVAPECFTALVSASLITNHAALSTDSSNRRPTSAGSASTCTGIGSRADRWRDGHDQPAVGEDGREDAVHQFANLDQGGFGVLL